VLGLVHQIAHLCRGDAGKYCHWGPRPRTLRTPPRAWKYGSRRRKSR
jgi:hypothetical protein